VNLLCEEARYHAALFSVVAVSNRLEHCVLETGNYMYLYFETEIAKKQGTASHFFRAISVGKTDKMI
jgi:hypothetical protein